MYRFKWNKNLLQRTVRFNGHTRHDKVLKNERFFFQAQVFSYSHPRLSGYAPKKKLVKKDKTGKRY